MNNAAKHGQGDSVHLSLQINEGCLEFILRDNGCGFDPEKSGSGLGLAGIKERTGLSGGILAIDSAPGKGTVIKATWKDLKTEA